MILACGICAHWIFWTRFPPATPWAVTFMAWFLVLSAVTTFSQAKLAAVPRLPGALGLVLGSLILGTAIAGPLAGLWFAPACLLGSVSAARLPGGEGRLRRGVFFTGAMALVILAVLWSRSTSAYRHLSPAERVLLLQQTPAWSIELHRIGRGDCAALALVAGKASDQRLADAVRKRLAGECPAGSKGSSPHDGGVFGHLAGAE